MAQRKTLTVAQLEILRWIEQGCPGGVHDPSDPSHRISAAALDRRGLVETSGRGPTWSASITSAGRDYLEQATKPGAPPPRQANVSVTRQLVDEVINGGGTLRVSNDAGGDNYWRRAQLAERHGKVPDGKRMVVSRVGDEIEIKLLDSPARLGEVSVPGRVSRYAPVVRRFRDAKTRHEVSRAEMPRMLRILQGLVVEAERRGFDVEIVEGEEPRRYGSAGWSGGRDGHLRFSIRGHSESLRIREEGLPSRSYWIQQNSTYDYVKGESRPGPLSEYEEGATGRLEIEIVGYGGGGRASKWGDRRSWALEEKLPEILREIEMRAVEAEERKREAERREAERQRQWELAMERAKGRWLEAYRGQILERQADQWRTAETVRAYVDAMAAFAVGEEAEEWIEWSRAHADLVDPLTDGVRPPEPPDSIPLDELRPFLDGWSPYGPDHGRW